MSMKTIKWGIEAVVGVAIVASAACAPSTSSPSAPSATSAPAPTQAPTAATASLQIAINPNPVPFSGQPVTDAASCAGVKNTWFYQQNFKENGGVTVTLTSRIDKFDQRVVNNATNLNMVIPAMGAMTLQSRWCSAQAVAHTAQSSFSGIDANGHPVTVDGPVVDLRSP